MTRKFKRHLKNKDGIMTFNIIMFIPRIVFLIIVMFTVVLLIRTGSTINLKTAEFESNIMMNNLHNAIAYEDPVTGNIHPYLVDINNFDSKRLEQALYFDDNRFYAARLVLKDENGRFLKEAYYNLFWYNNWIVTIVPGMQAGFGVDRFERTLPVMYDSSNQRKIGQVTFEVLIPRRTKVID